MSVIAQNRLMNAIMLNRLIILFASLGMVISALLWISHSADFALPCTGGGCDEVARSPYSRLAGIPVAALGFGYFGLLVLLALSRLQYPEQWRTYGKMLAALSTLGVLAFAYFTYVQLFVLNLYAKGAPCWWCLAAAGTNLVVWLLSLMGLRGALQATGVLTRELAQSLTVSLALVIAGLAYGGWQWNRATTAQTIRTDNEKLTLLYLDGQGWRKGNPKAPLVIVEFSDFQCPACAAAYERLRTSLSGRRDVRLVFRHFPLDSRCNPTVSRPVHELACTAAAAAECAGQQGKFWDYHDRLFAEQRFLDRETLFRFARELGLAIPRFRTCLDDPATLASVTDDIAAATALGIESTPTLFVNGRRLEGVLEPPYWEFALVLARHDLEQGSRP